MTGAILGILGSWVLAGALARLARGELKEVVSRLISKGFTVFIKYLHFIHLY